jgi:plasmid maintenance system antidote protein VapI
MNKDKKAKDPRRNKIFAAAYDHLKRTQGVRTQEQLAEKMGVSPETVSRIIRARTDVTEDAISRLQTASGCIFNLQWLRGESDVMLVADIKKNDGHATEATSPSSPDMSSMINSIIAAKDDAITSLKRELASKDETIAAKDETIATKEAAIADKDAVIKAKEAAIADKDVLIKTLQLQVTDLRAQLAIQKGLSDGYPYPVGVAERDQRTAKRP